MLKPNMNYKLLDESELFITVYKKTHEYEKAHPDKKIYKLGVGDVTLPLCDEVIKALHEAVDDQAKATTFHGYMPECGDDALRNEIAMHYQSLNAQISPSEIFISSGAGDDISDISDIFDNDNTVLIIEPTYPEYADISILSGRKIIHMPSGIENDFLPEPNENFTADIIYLCSPNNPTGAAFSKEKLQKWVDFANRHGSVIVFDFAYEIFIEDDCIPKTIYELKDADKCAIEICSLSKTAGFTGTRLGYTVVPHNIVRFGMNLNEMWVQNRQRRTNGVSYILQKGAMAVFTPKGQEQIRENINVYKNNAKYLMNALDEAGVWYTGGKNSPYIWMKCPDNMSGWEFFDYLLNEIQLVGIPGEGFGECGKGYFRLSSFASSSDTIEASKLLTTLMKKLNSCN